MISNQRLKTPPKYLNYRPALLGWRLLSRSGLILLVILVIASSLSGCSPVRVVEQSAISKWVLLDKMTRVGQSFLASDAGLTGIRVYLSPHQLAPGEINLSLVSRDSRLEIATSIVKIDAIQTTGWYEFPFPPIPDSQGEDYEFVLSLNGSGMIDVGSHDGNAYRDGAHYLNGSPQEAQLAFELIYAPLAYVMGMIHSGIGWLSLLIAAFFLFVLPGWVLLSLVWRQWSAEDWMTKIGLSAGISLAIYPLLLLWTDVIGLHLGVIYAWAPASIGLLVGLWQFRRRKNRITWGSVRACWMNTFQKDSTWVVNGALLVVLLLVFGVRFWVIRDLDAPLWGDSYQHTVLAQLIIDHGGLFDRWEPYAELETLTYHFGFHTLVAVFYWLMNSVGQSHFGMPLSVLWTGQILNGLVILSLYPWVSRLTPNRWAGVVAIVVAGLLLPLPMGYTNWGRYTQLAGLVILNSVTILVWEVIRLARERRLSGEHSPQGLAEAQISPLILAGWVGLSGLGLTHYRVLMIAGLFVIAAGIVEWRRKTLRVVFVRGMVIILGAGILFFPWGWHVYGGTLMQILQQRIFTWTSAANPTATSGNEIGSLALYLPGWAWVGMMFIILWGWFRRNQGIILLTLWAGLVLLSANPEWLWLPGSGLLSNFTVFISVFILASVMIGVGLVWVVEWLRQGTWYRLAVLNRSRQLQGVAFIFLCIVSVWGAIQRSRDIQPDVFGLVTRPDLRAASWIRSNLPQSARFLVNSFFAYDGTLVVGSDGGWWLPILAERRTTLPPLTYGFETGTNFSELEQVNTLTAAIQAYGVLDVRVLELLAERQVTHVYIGQRQGRVNYTGPYTLNPAEMLADEHFELVYRQDQIWIFALMVKP